MRDMMPHGAERVQLSGAMAGVLRLIGPTHGSGAAGGGSAGVVGIWSVAAGRRGFERTKTLFL